MRLSSGFFAGWQLFFPVKLDIVYKLKVEYNKQVLPLGNAGMETIVSILNILLIVLGYLFLLAGTKLLEIGGISLMRVRPTTDAQERIFGWLAACIFPFFILGIAGGITGAGTMIFSAAITAGVLELLLVFGMAALSQNYSLKGNFLRDLTVLFVSVVVLVVMTSYTWSQGHPSTQIGVVQGIILIILAILFFAWTWSYFTAKSKRRQQSAPFNEIPSAVMAAMGIALGGLGGVLLLNSTLKLSADLGVSQSVFGFAIVGLGISIPQYFRVAQGLSKSRQVSVRKTLAAGNMGMLLMIGITALISPISVGWGGAVLLLLSIAAIVIFFLAACYGKVVGRAKAAVLLVSYMAIFLIFMQFNI